MRKENEFDKLALNSIVKGIDLRGYHGAVIFRGEGHSKQVTGRVSLLRSNTPISSEVRKPDGSLLSVCSQADSIKVKEDLHLGSELFWSEFYFSNYAFDLVALLNGTFEVGRLSSFH